LKAISWASGVNYTKKRYFFLFRLQTFFYFCHVFTFFNVFKFLFERFYIYASGLIYWISGGSVYRGKKADGMLAGKGEV